MTDTRHLDDETLSGVLDGDAAPAHLGGCATCSVRLSELRRAVDAVASPPPALAEARRRLMLDRALSGHARPASHDDDHDDRVVSLRRPNMARWSGIAAVLVVLIGVGALMTGRGDDGDRDMAAEGAADETSALATRLADEQPAVDGGDLGARRDPAELGGIIRDALATAKGEGGAATMASPAPDGGGAVADTNAAQSGVGGRAGVLPCRTEARSEYGSGLGALVYGALVQWEDVPAVVLAYESPSASADGKVTYLGLVLARDGCRTLTSIFQTS